jgi:hypothetical protein
MASAAESRVVRPLWMDRLEMLSGYYDSEWPLSSHQKKDLNPGMLALVHNQTCRSWTYGELPADSTVEDLTDHPLAFMVRHANGEYVSVSVCETVSRLNDGFIYAEILSQRTDDCERLGSHAKLIERLNELSRLVSLRG